MSVLNMIIGQVKMMIIPCLISFPIILLLRYLTYKRTGFFNKKHEALITIFWLYIIALLSVTIFPEALMRGDFSAFMFNKPDLSTINYKSVIGWIQWKIYLQDYADLVKNIAGNVFVFIPFGLLFPIVYKNKSKLTVPLGVLFSVFIEFCQLFSERQTDLTDVLLNTLGIITGFIIYLIIKKASKK